MLSAISFEIAESMYVQPKVYRKPSFNRVPEKILQPQLYRPDHIRPPSANPVKEHKRRILIHERRNTLS